MRTKIYRQEVINSEGRVINIRHTIDEVVFFTWREMHRNFVDKDISDNPLSRKFYEGTIEWDEVTEEDV